MGKKIVVLNGSPRRKGQHVRAGARAFTEGAEASGNTVTEFFLDAMGIHGCKGCFGGHSAKSTPACSATAWTRYTRGARVRRGGAGVAAVLLEHERPDPHGGRPPVRAGGGRRQPAARARALLRAAHGGRGPRVRGRGDLLRQPDGPPALGEPGPRAGRRQRRRGRHRPESPSWSKRANWASRSVSGIRMAGKLAVAVVSCRRGGASAASPRLRGSSAIDLISCLVYVDGLSSERPSTRCASLVRFRICVPEFHSHSMASVLSSRHSSCTQFSASTRNACRRMTRCRVSSASGTKVGTTSKTFFQTQGIEFCFLSQRSFRP